jgi:hypothetical protein
VIDLENPFCTARVAPGAIPYLFPPGVTAAVLAARLDTQGGWGEITGPRGSGKSTLLTALIPVLVHSGWQPFLVTLHDGQRRLPPEAVQQVRASARSDRPLLVIDGYEQLSAWSRCCVKRGCRKRGSGLLVTAHRRAGFPSLYRTSVAPATAEQVVHWLTDGPERLVAPGEVRGPLATHHGNLREALFALYDLHEQRRRGAGRVRGFPYHSGLAGAAPRKGPEDRPASRS